MVEIEIADNWQEMAPILVRDIRREKNFVKYFCSLALVDDLIEKGFTVNAAVRNRRTKGRFMVTMHLFEPVSDSYAEKMVLKFL